MSNDLNPRRKLQKDIDVTTMYNMRAQGMTNKQIAFALGVHPNTIYKYIGRKSEAVKHAEVQNKPPVVNPQPVQIEEVKAPTLIEKARNENAERKKAMEAEKHVIKPDVPSAASTNDVTSVTQAHDAIEHKESEAKPYDGRKSTLRVISQRVSLEGNICKYVVDSESNSLEIIDGTVTGLLDRETLMAFIEELKEIAPMIGV